MRLALPFASWCALLVGGFAYVGGVLCQRDNPLHSGNGDLTDLLVVLLLSPLFFFLGPRHNWQPLESSSLGALRWNGLCYALPFLLTLHWEFVGEALGVRFSLKAADLGALDGRSVVALVTACMTLALLVACHVVWARRVGILVPYLAALIGIPIVIGLVSLGLGDAYYLHVHHYCVGAFLFPFFRFPRVPSFIAQAVFLGLAVEGISRWGMDAVWYAAS